MAKVLQWGRGKGEAGIAGADVWITNPEVPEDATRLLLLARNVGKGYQQLCELLTRAHLVKTVETEQRFAERVVG